MAVAFIQGASRGIGLEFARLLSKRPGIQVVASCRSPGKAEQLAALPSVHVVKCDITSEDDLVKTASFISDRFGKLDLAVNVSGMLHPSGKGETKLADVTLQGLKDTFDVNVFGPLMTSKYVGPLLKKGDGLIGSQKDEEKKHSGILVNMSARVGSISENGLGGWYSYRMSKAALNMANKNLSIEFALGKKNVVCLALHPGTVDTDLSRPYHRGVPEGKLFSTEFSVTKLMEIIDGASIADTGRYVAWDGQDIAF